ncbi:hypothetical protein B296_00054851 [Ensete ventricosum]|uniref:Uncharacterized protein n=1 Tax=Ensete ventricosum TaxID=4639 RepID=A0A426X643_ENSVE|nr:hypothetical protein B296_00054851 [Ensete ventricosum]
MFLQQRYYGSGQPPADRPLQGRPPTARQPARAINYDEGPYRGNPVRVGPPARVVAYGQLRVGAARKGQSQPAWLLFISVLPMGIGNTRRGGAHRSVSCGHCARPPVGGVSGACQDGTKEFARRRPRLTGRLSGVAEKIVGTSASSQVRTMRWDLAGSSLGDSQKELRRSLRTRREIAGKKTGGHTTSMSEVTGLVDVR